MQSPSSAQYEVLQQAAAWYATLGADNVTEQQRQKWQRWLEQRPEHRKAWALVEQVGGRFAPLSDPAERSAAFNALQPGRGLPMGRRQMLLALGAVSVAAVTGWRGLRDTVAADHLRGLWADYSTATGETREVALNGQTRLWLNTLSAVDLSAANDHDALNLLAGELLIDSQAGAARGQIVRSRHGQLSARGAAYGVRLLQDSTCVSVYRGQLDIVSGDQRCTLGEGQQVSFSTGHFDAVQAAPASGKAWTQGILVAQGMTLRQFCLELSRYRHGYLGCAPGVGDLRVVGTFSIKDTDRALQSLASALPVAIKQVMPWWVTVEARV